MMYNKLIATTDTSDILCLILNIEIIREISNNIFIAIGFIIIYQYKNPTKFLIK